MAKVAKVLSVYDEHARLMKEYNILFNQRLPHIDAGYDKNDWKQDPESQKHKQEYDRLYNESERLKEEAYKLSAAHLKPFSDATDRLNNRAYNDRKNITEYKRARLKLWKEQDKFKAAIAKSYGRKPAKINHNPNLDFE